MKKAFVILAMLNICMPGSSIFAQSANTLRYKQPAQYFEESLVSETVPWAPPSSAV